MPDPQVLAHFSVDGDGLDDANANGEIDQKEIPVRISSPSLPPVSSRSQPLGFPSPPHPPSQTTPFAPTILANANGTAAHTDAPVIQTRPATARGRVIQELHVALKGHNASHSMPVQSLGHREDDEGIALMGVLDAFRSLSLLDQSHALSFALHEHSLLDALLEYFLTRHAGSADDPLCRWLYELYFNASNGQSVVFTTIPVAPASAGASSVATSTVAATPTAVLFVLHLLPILVYTFMFRSARSIPCPGIAAVILAVYNAYRAHVNKAPHQHSPLVDFAKIAKNPFGPTNLATADATAPTTLASPRQNAKPVKSALPLIDDPTNSASLYQLVSVVLNVYVSHLSSMSVSSQQQFCSMCARLSDSSQTDEIALFLRMCQVEYRWPADWSHSQGEKSSHRYALTVDLLQVAVVGLTYCVCYPHVRELALLSLRCVHCRAVEELIPEILLQTTAVLEAVED